MQTYSEFRPSAFDTAGLGCDNRHDWLVYGGASITRDTPEASYTFSNWRVTLRELEKECGDEGEENGWGVHRFGHWGSGWFEIILVKPDSKAKLVCGQFEDVLSDYPILDGADYSEREYECALEYWSQASLRDRIAICKKARVSILQARHETVSDRVFERLQIIVSEG